MIRNILFIYSLLFGCLFCSCKEEDGIKREQAVTLDKTEVNVWINQETIITPTFDSGSVPVRSYVWEIDNTDIAEVTSVDEAFVATLTGLTPGTTTATLTSTDGALEVKCTITVVNPETSATLQETVNLNIKQQGILNPVFNTTPVRSYEWTSDPEGIIKLNVDESTHAITVEGLREGTTTLTLKSTDEVVTASTEITVTFVEDDIIKILTIGNSFSEDAVEYYLHGLTQAAGKDIVIGNMYIGGAQLSLHQSNANSNANAYSYRKIKLDGTKSTTGGFSINAAIEDEDWDYISFQQASDFSGKYETFTTPLPFLVNYTKARATNPNVQYVLHQTWAYAQTSTHPAFPSYGSNQMTMFEVIVQTYSSAAELANIDLVVPSGTAIQNGRTSFIGDNFNSDGYHLNAIGRYTASCTWFEKLFNESVVGNTYKPAGYSQEQVDVAQESAHNAVAHPAVVTPFD